MSIPAIPDSLNSIQRFIKTAILLEERDPVVAYYCRMHAIQIGMKIDCSTNPAKKYLGYLMDELEKAKTKNSSNDAIKDDIIGRSYIENYALNLFSQAYQLDLSSQFNQNLVKKFFTAKILFDVLDGMMELQEDMKKMQKYSLWKSTYIHNCLKKGETPIAGPLEGQVSGLEMMNLNADTSSFPPTQPTFPSQPLTPHYQDNGQAPSSSNQYPPQGGNNLIPPNTPLPMPRQTYPSNPSIQQPHASSIPANSSYVPKQSSINLSKEQITRAAKLSKFAASALTYEDVNEAIIQLKKALNLLTTGSED